MSSASTSGTFHVDDRSTMWIRSTVAGVFDDPVCIQLISIVDDWRGSRTGLTVFSDISGVTDYDVPARERVSAWMKRLGNAFGDVHVLVSGRTIAWALKIVAVASGAKIIAYHSKTEFELAFQRFTNRAPARAG